MEKRVKKANLLINARGETKYSSNELKLIATLIEQVKTTDTIFKEKYINLKDIEFLEDDYNNHSYLDSLCQSIMSKPFKIPNTKVWVNWFSQMECKNGFIQYCFTPALKPYLLELKGNYTLYELKNIIPLKSSYSIQIFELLKQLEKYVFRKIILEDFKEILNIPKSYKTNDIKRLIERSQKELKEKSKFYFEPHYKKKGRKITHINFEVIYHMNY